MKKVLLVEPKYKNKYPPMGLMKLSTFYKQKGYEVEFFKGEIKDLVLKICLENLYQLKPNLQENEKEIIAFWTRNIKNQAQYYANEQKYIYQATLDKVLGKTKQQDLFAEINTTKYDIICITTLFTFYYQITIDCINQVKNLLNANGHIFIGGIASSLLMKQFERDTGIKPVFGILDNTHNVINQAENDTTTIIDNLPLDYSILEEVDYEYTVPNSYFAYATRGCVRDCAFCMVPTLEPKFVPFISIKEQIKATKDKFGDKQHLCLLDNNVFASKKYFNEIIDEIIEAGFGKGATYKEPNQYEIAYQNLEDKQYQKGAIKQINKLYQKHKISNDFHNLEQIKAKHQEVKEVFAKYYANKKAVQRFVDFNQGLDARLLLRRPEMAKRFAEINLRPARLAFDAYTPELIEAYTQGMRLLAENGITHLANYLLYNFEDEPVELYQRMKITVDLCEELNVAIMSFPMRYQPITDENYFYKRDFVGEHWNTKYIRAVQAVLSATMGKIGRGKSFFEAAFGRSEDEFLEILNMPEHLIMKRFENDEAKREAFPEIWQKYKAKNLAITNITDLWREQFNSLNGIQKQKLFLITHTNKFDKNSDDKKVNQILSFYQHKLEEIKIKYDKNKVALFDDVIDATLSDDFKDKYKSEAKNQLIFKG